MIEEGETMTNEVQNTEEIQEKLSVMRKIELYFLLGIAMIVVAFYFVFLEMTEPEAPNEEVKP